MDGQVELSEDAGSPRLERINRRAMSASPESDFARLERQTALSALFAGRVQVRPRVPCASAPPCATRDALSRAACICSTCFDLLPRAALKIVTRACELDSSALIFFISAAEAASCSRSSSTSSRSAACSRSASLFCVASGAGGDDCCRLAPSSTESSRGGTISDSWCIIVSTLDSANSGFKPGWRRKLQSPVPDPAPMGC
mmetsp:Transcript_25763/g.65002  ORF Transcript_25763/g.65002 Transcript_25763/m.65002 type:complete len:200 (+) Transcript_25763:495-1094(+)